MRLIAFVLISSSSAFCLPLANNLKNINTPPPRIIRTCCSFGSEVKVSGIPFLKVNDIVSKTGLGKHVYLGADAENNGIIYTRKGGFIDIGHLRDQADWTAYLFQQIIFSEHDELSIELGREGGQKRLLFNSLTSLSQTDKNKLAGKVAYDLSVWHEIATYFGASYIPMVPERYSAFSMEDAYSNLLGVQIGMEALRSPLPFEEAVTFLLNKKLDELDAVKNISDSYDAMEQVRGLWWTREVKIPNKKLLLKREFEIENCLKPWLVNEKLDAYLAINCPERFLENGKPLENYCEFSIQLNSKFPVKRLFGKEGNRTITQKDFKTLIAEAKRKDGFI